MEDQNEKNQTQNGKVKSLYKIEKSEPSSSNRPTINNEDSQRNTEGTIRPQEVEYDPYANYQGMALEDSDSDDPADFMRNVEFESKNKNPKRYKFGGASKSKPNSPYFPSSSDDEETKLRTAEEELDREEEALRRQTNLINQMEETGIQKIDDMIKKIENMREDLEKKKAAYQTSMHERAQMAMLSPPKLKNATSVHANPVEYKKRKQKVKKRKEKIDKNLNKQRDKRISVQEAVSTNPRLGKVIKNMATEPHPLDTEILLSQMFMGPARPYLDLAQTVEIDNQCHYQLPFLEKVSNAFSTLGRMLYDNELPFELSDYKLELGFDMKQKLESNMSSAFFSAYPTTLMVFCVLIPVLESIGGILAVFLTKESLEVISEQVDKTGKISDRIVILKFFLAIWLLKFVLQVLDDWGKLQRHRYFIRLSSALHLLIFEKLLRIRILNPNAIDEGRIINHLENDIDFLEGFVPAFHTFVKSLLNLTFCVCLGFYYFGQIFLTLLLGLLLLGGGVLVVMRVLRMSYYRWGERVDRRLTNFKNLLKNMRFVKMFAYENLFFWRLESEREREVNILDKINSISYALDVISALSSPLLISSFLLIFFETGDNFTVSTITVFLILVDILSDATKSLPDSMQEISNGLLNLQRIENFLNSPEFKHWDLLGNNERKKTDLAINIENCTFYWNRKLKAFSRQRRDTKAKIQKGKEIQNQADRKTMSKKFESLGMNSQAMSEPLVRRKGSSSEPSSSFTLENFSFRAKKGELTVIIGEIGSGKSTVLYSILGETLLEKRRDSTIWINGTIDFVGQTPWILNATVKENIILNKAYDKIKFDWAIKHSALSRDFESWAAKEMQMIGKDGGELSLGQKARLNLARALYQNPDIFLFDDIFASLDPKSAEFIIKETLLKELRDKSIILVTQNFHMLKYSDYIYFMEDGVVSIEGNFNDITKTDLYKKFIALKEESRKVILTSKTNYFRSQRRRSSIRSESDLCRSIRRKSSMGSGKKGRKTIDDEDAKEINIITNDLVKEFKDKNKSRAGTISATIINSFIKAFGGYIMMGLFLLNTIFFVGLNIYSNKFLEEQHKHFNDASRYFYLQIYMTICVFSVLGQLIQAFIKRGIGYRLSISVHSNMLYALLHSKLEQFLERVPNGLIVEKFANDIADVDRASVGAFAVFTNKFIEVIIISLTIGFTIGWQLVLFAAIWLIVVFRLEKRFINARREYKRLEEAAEGPVLNLFSEVIKGLPNVRCQNLGNFFRQRMFQKVSEAMKNVLLDKIFKSWFTLNSNLCLQFLVQLPALVGLLYFFNNVSPANIGLFFVLAFNMGKSLLEMSNEKTEFEICMISMENCNYFSEIEVEQGYRHFEWERATFGLGGKSQLKKLIKYEKTIHERIQRESSVNKGEVIFDGVSAERTNSDIGKVMDLAFILSPGEKLGIVGRSGSGKSTIVELIWRFIRPSKGKIYIDGQDINEMDLKKLRSQVDVISQETALFAGTLRQSLDPSGFKHNDAEMIEILEKLNFVNLEYQRSGLDMLLDSEGTNLSQGEKQLICFARSLLHPKNLILLDEATAYIDIRTEEAIRKIIKSAFTELSMIIVAHKIQTVWDCDHILVLKDGKMEDFGAPHELLEKGGYFQEIIEMMKKK